MAILLSASALGAPDLFKLRNRDQTAAYWAAHHQAGWREGGGEIISFTRALRANPVAKSGSLSHLKLMEY